MLLSIQKLSCSYGTNPVLREVSFDAEGGRTVAVLGANGAGKTTLFRCILGLVRGYEGSILLEGAEARTLPPRRLSELAAYIPQSGAALPGYSVLSMVETGTARQLSPFSSPGETQRKAAWAALEQVGMEGFATRRFDRLSGGEQQMVLIARALAQRSRILLMDEPSAHLDFGNNLRVLDRLRRLAGEEYLILFSTHDPQTALQHAQAVLALCDGTVAAYGPPDKVLDAALLRRLYGVEVRLLETDAGRFVIPGREKRA
ncbi:ABC transporter ATP-binding protein [Oscillibacter sp.]|uniref:ABC transporter ATP-binding protein n=1 Tax=Oscillibacter sp. TaxID=1945593 RepID=UPI00289ADB02|nr:ABC transporter ATP-binding protein [Oscillibacter sp.]